MKRKILAIITALMIIAAFMPCAFADEIDGGRCGTNAEWSLDSDGTLTISGTGEARRVSQISNYAEEITKIVVEEGITVLDDNTVKAMPNLTEVSLPSTLSEIGYGNFRYCGSLAGFKIPAGLIVIDIDFVGCTSLKAFEVDEANTKFKGVNGVVFNTSGDTLELYPPAADAEEYSIPEGTVTIGEDAFSGAFKLKKLTIPSTIERPLSGFNGCDALEEIVVDEGNEKYMSENGIFFDKDKTELYFYPRTRAGEYTVPDTVTMIDYAAFDGNKVLDSVTIPDSVTEIGTMAFRNCTSLKEIHIPSSVTTLGRNVFNGCTELDNAIIDADITTLEDSMFEGCTSLKEVTLPAGVTNIGTNAFEGCTAIEEFTFGEGITKISPYAFSYCTNLKTVYLPSTIENIGAYAFNGTDLELVYYNGTENSWNNISIDGMNRPLTHYSERVYTLKPTINGSPDYAGGTVTVPLTETSMDCILIAAAYKDNVLLKVNSKALAKESDSDSIELTADGADNIVVYIWDKLNGLVPMCQNEGITVEQAS